MEHGDAVHAGAVMVGVRGAVTVALKAGTSPPAAENVRVSPPEKNGVFVVARE
jgi:hypothetical protein